MEGKTNEERQQVEEALAGPMTRQERVARVASLGGDVKAVER